MGQAARGEAARLSLQTGKRRSVVTSWTFRLFGSRLVIEVDGGQHNLHEGAQSDLERDAFLRSQGFRVLRYWNSDVDQNLEGVMESIFSALQTPTPPLRHSRCFASAFLALRTAAEGRLRPPHKGEG